jgi:hypothetical protein
MGELPLVLERQALTHAEAVLLVDDGQAEAGELHLVLDQGMGADRDRRLASADFCDRRILVLLFQAARQPGHFDAQRRQPGGELAVMLLGEDFGRRHQRRLVAGLDRVQHGQRRDDGLAAADIALQQALHRVRLREVGGNLAPGALLGGSEAERK